MSEWLGYNESELLSRIAEGDEAAFTALLRIIVPSLEAIVMKIVRQEDAAREILQETFVRIWMNRDKLPHLEKPGPWLKRVALNETFTWLKKNAARARIFGDIEQDIPVFTNTGLDNLSLRETEKVLQQAIEQLPPQRKRIYQMSRVEGMKSAEIAEELKLSQGYVKNALTAALDFLKQRLEEAGKFLSLFSF